MNMVGVELTNFINPNLTWKTSSKGTKNATRRPRKLNTKSLRVGVEQTENNPGAENTSISESEKPDMPVLGMRFADKVEHLPIKKRKFLFRSSPPPRTPSPNRGDSEQLVNGPCTSDQSAYPCSTSKQQGLNISVSTALKYSSVVDEVVNGETSEMKKEMAGCSMNLSGIEMLAAAACDDATGDDAGISGYNSAVEEVSVRKEMAGPSTMQSQMLVLCSPKKSHVEDLGASMAVLQDTSTSRDCDTEKKTQSSHDDRSHWDLNTVMDAWEQPDLLVDTQINATDTSPEDHICCENKDAWEVYSLQRDIRNNTDAKIQHIVKNDILLDGPSGSSLFSGSSNLDFSASKLCGDELNFNTKANQLSAEERCLTPIESAAFSASGAQTSTQVVNTGSCLDFSSCAGSICTTATFVSEENKKSAPSIDIAEKKTVDIASGMHPGVSVGLEAVLVEKHPDSGNTTLERTLKQESGDYANATCFHDQAIKNDNTVSKMQLGASAALNETLLVEKHDHASNHTLDSRNNTLVGNQKEGCGDIGNTTCLHDASSSRTEKHQFPGHEAIDVEDPGLKSSLQCEDSSPSFGSVGGRLPASTNDATAQDDKASGACWNEVDPPVNLDLKEPVVKSSVHHTSVADGSTPVDECKSCCDNSPDCRSGKMFCSDVFQNGQDHVVGMENMAELHEGYDSQFEDGEVRESRVNCWEDSEAEDGETEQVDYGSDDEHMYEPVDFCSPSESRRLCSRGSLPTNSVVAELTKRSVMHPMEEIIRKDGSEKLEMDIDVDRGLSAGSADMSMSGKDEHLSAIDVVKDSGHSASSGEKMSARDQRPEGLVISSEIAKEVADGNMRSSNLNGSLVRDSESSRRMPSHNGLSSFHLFHRNHNNRLQPDRSNDHDDYCAQAERGPFGSDRSMGRMRSSLQMQGRHRVGSQWDDNKSGLWNSKRQHSPSYDGRYDSWKPRPRNILENSYAEVEDDAASDHTIQKADGPDFNWRRPERPMYSPPKGAYRPFIRRRFTAERQNDNHMYRGQAPAGDFGLDRNRGRPGRFTQRLSPRPGYFKTLPNDSNEPFAHMPPSIARRERSFSPVLHREYQRFPRPQERYRSSRSRSRSPVMRQFPSERNAGYRTFSRSQDFKPEGRMERARLPMRKPGFASDYEAGDMSPPRNRFSPQQRWVSDKNNTGDGFRSRRSPVRMFRQNRRFNSPGSPGRGRSDDYFRPAQPRRFPDMAFAVRGRKDGAEEDRRKPHNRFDMFQSARFVAHSSHDKDGCITERWHGDDVLPRGARDERDRQ